MKVEVGYVKNFDLPDHMIRAIIRRTHRFGGKGAGDPIAPAPHRNTENQGVIE